MGQITTEELFEMTGELFEELIVFQDNKEPLTHETGVYTESSNKLYIKDIYGITIYHWDKLNRVVIK